jgi:ATP-dependent protease ClpP protease subunit
MYRFRGGVEPREGIKTPIRAEAPAGDVVDGVATMRLYDPIDSWGGWWGVSASEFVQALDELGSDVHEIRLHINSPGGEIYEAVTIKNALTRHRARVVAIVDGIAASAASFVAAAADELVMGRHTELMIHDGWGIFIGPEATVRKGADRLGSLSNTMAGIYRDKAGGTVEQWRDLMIEETWYTAEEAVEAGLADRVEGDQDDDVDALASAPTGRQLPPPAREPATPAGTPRLDHAARLMRAYQTRYRLPAGS